MPAGDNAVPGRRGFQRAAQPVWARPTAPPPDDEDDRDLREDGGATCPSCGMWMHEYDDEQYICSECDRDDDDDREWADDD